MFQEQLGITEKRTREGFAMQVAFELGLQGSDALKGKDKCFLSENVMSKVQEEGETQSYSPIDADTSV